MIECRLEPMPDVDEKRLRAWLHKEELGLLERVAEAQVRRSQVDFSTDAIKSTPADELLTRANEKLAAAQRYQTFLDVLKEIINHPTPVHIAKVF